MGFDGIWLDMEHYHHSIETGSELMRASRVGSADIIARPAKGEFMRMARMLEIGAQGIMYPRCESPQEAREAVRWSKFAPLGQRGFDGGNADSDYAGTTVTDYVQHVNRETFLIVQLEQQSSVDQAEAIAAVPGVDLLMLGPADFSILEGIPGDFLHERIDAAIHKVAIAAKNTGKNWACTVASTQQATKALELGARLIFQGADIFYVRRGLEQLRDDYQKLGFKFDIKNC
jgi:4-hydroxy-2-oxoheptanedioate aldolase